MSWIQGRQTDREEDLAYCLFGIFDVHMPLIYGEGQGNAFNRFKREIAKPMDVESLLTNSQTRILSQISILGPLNLRQRKFIGREECLGSTTAGNENHLSSRHKRYWQDSNRSAIH